jgi:RNA polymerase sigma-70 factor, ECF subfamily
MNADALITLLADEAVREELYTDLDQLLAARAAGTIRDADLAMLEARAVELPEFRRTLEAYTPLSAAVEQRIVGAVRAALGREPTGPSSRRASPLDSDMMRARSGASDSDMMRARSRAPDSDVMRSSHVLQRGAAGSWGTDRELSLAEPASTRDTPSAYEASAVYEAPASEAPASSVAQPASSPEAALRMGASSSSPSEALQSGPLSVEGGLPLADRCPFTSDVSPRPTTVFPVDGEEAFELQMRQAYADGQQAWPPVKLSYEAFAAHVRRAVGKAPDWEWNRHAGDLYLCCACARGEREATRLLDTQILPRAAKAIARIESDAHFVDEAVQILRHKLFVGPDAKISVYSGRGSLTAWLRVTATRVALDGLRALGAQRAQQVDLQDRMAQPSVNPLNDLVKSRYAEAFQEALRTAIRELSVRDRNLLRLRLVGHCGIDQLGQMYRVHRATAARWLNAAHTRVFDSVREQLRTRFQLSDDEFDQMALDMQSRLELSLSGLAVDGMPLPPAPDEPAAEDRPTLPSEPHLGSLDESAQLNLGEEDTEPAGAFGWRRE